jgi:hypothetical protein
MWWIALFGIGGALWCFFKLGKLKVKHDLEDNVARIHEFQKKENYTTEELEDILQETKDFLKSNF